MIFFAILYHCISITVWSLSRCILLDVYITYYKGCDFPAHFLISYVILTCFSAWNVSMAPQQLITDFDIVVQVFKTINKSDCWKYQWNVTTTTQTSTRRTIRGEKIIYSEEISDLCQVRSSAFQPISGQLENLFNYQSTGGNVVICFSKRKSRHFPKTK